MSYAKSNGIAEYTYLPHHKSFSEESSRTTRLSLGDRPVLAPERVASAPVEVTNDPLSYLIACSYSSASFGLVFFFCL